MQSPGTAPSPNAAAALSPAPAPSSAPWEAVPADSGAEDLRNHGTPPAEGQFQQVGLDGVALGGEVPRSARVAAIGAQIGDVRRATQPPRQPVVRQAHRRGRVGVAWFMVGQPAQLRRCDSRDRHHPGATRPCLRASEFVGQFSGRVSRPGVVPQQCVSNDSAMGIQADHAVLLGADRDCRDVGDAADGAHGLLERIPPTIRMDLGAIGMRCGRRAQDLSAVRVAHQYLA